MVGFIKPHRAPPPNSGRKDLFIDELGQYQNIIQKWIDHLQDEAKRNSNDISQFKFGKTLGYLLLQGLKRAKISPDDFKSLASDPWEAPEYKLIDRTTGIIQDRYRIYFEIPGSSSFNNGQRESAQEQINANKANAQIPYFTTITNDGLMVFSFEDKIEPISFGLFTELAENIEVESDAWSRLIHLIKTQRPTTQNPNREQQYKILGLILYANIIPERRDDVFNDICLELVKIENNEFNHNFNSTIVSLLKDIIPGYENKVMDFLHKNNKESDISEQGSILELPSEKIDVITNEMKARKSLEEQNNKHSEAEQLRKTLVGAIDEYLRWRDNKSTEKDYKQSSGYFTWLRHYTDFGKNRADDLNNELNKAQDLNTMIDVLQKHFSNNSRLNNHSLDSYLVRALYKDFNQFKSIVNFEHLSIKGDTQANREWIRDELLRDVLKKETKKDLNVRLERPQVEQQGRSTLPNKTKTQINIMKIPANEREENILAVYIVLKNDELLKNQEGSVPELIKEIREIVGKLNPSKEGDIANAIIEIKRKIGESRESQYGENAQSLIEAFAKPSCCDFQKIRAALSTNPAMDEIMNPVRVGIELN
ncbi:hypothetical protein [Legionella sainthelensi]|uniref:hypothetical protein n=1 Tax=Legionella sainthelensi TaxID=28087 RepID=UPI000E208885|nr:hypothetical protein [Legionella sainthelensi]